MTGVDDPYEEPVAPEVHVYTASCAPETSAEQVLDYLVRQGFVSPKPPV